MQLREGKVSHAASPVQAGVVDQGDLLLVGRQRVTCWNGDIYQIGKKDKYDKNKLGLSCAKLRAQLASSDLKAWYIQLKPNLYL